MKILKIYSAFLLVIFFVDFGVTETAQQKGAAIMRKNENLPVFQKVKANIRLKIYNKSGKLRFNKNLVMASYTENMGTRNATEKFIGSFLEPAEDKGNSILVYDFNSKPDVKYIYYKAIRKIKKVVGADKKLRFFGSDFTNSDAGKPDYYDWKYRYLGEKEVAFKGKKLLCYVVECVPRDQATKRNLGYGKKIAYIEKQTFLSLKYEFFDENLKKWKNFTLKSFIVKKNIMGQKVYYTTGLEMRDLKTGTYSQLHFSNFYFERDAKFNTNIFSQQYLTRKWW